MAHVFQSDFCSASKVRTEKLAANRKTRLAGWRRKVWRSTPRSIWCGVFSGWCFFIQESHGSRFALHQTRSPPPMTAKRDIHNFHLNFNFIKVNICGYWNSWKSFPSPTTLSWIPFAERIRFEMRGPPNMLIPFAQQTRHKVPNEC